MCAQTVPSGALSGVPVIPINASEGFSVERDRKAFRSAYELIAGAPKLFEPRGVSLIPDAITLLNDSFESCVG